ncbi:HEAT repeat domain-containing protein [Ktedonosporobacter rubrisoli]|nr:HEAT repeat domain-containing protein [Ktedonosporobacter rubrisoli]
MVLQPPTLPQDLLDQLANANAKIRKTALKQMASLPASSQRNQLLIQTLSTDENASNCAFAAQILGQLQAKEAIDTLLLVLTKHTNKNVRLKIVTALGQLGDRKVVDVLLQALVKDRGIEVRREAIRVLVGWRELRALPALQKAYEKTKDRASSYHSLCQDVLLALSELGGVEPLLPII